MRVRELADSHKNKSQVIATEAVNYPPLSRTSLQAVQLVFRTGCRGLPIMLYPMRDHVGRHYVWQGRSRWGCGIACE